MRESKKMWKSLQVISRKIGTIQQWCTCIVRLTIFANSPQIPMTLQYNLLSHHIFRTFISTPVTDLMRAIRTSLPINRSSSSRCRRLSSIARLCFSSFRCLPYSMMLAHVIKQSVQLWTLPLVNKVESMFTWNNCVSFYS